MTSDNFQIVLIVDDEKEVLNSIERELRNHFSVKTETDPRRALEFFKTNDVCVVLSDLRMPSMNGLEFLSECHKIKPQVPRLLLTAFVDLADTQEAINKAQLNRVLTKPWDKANLITAIGDLSHQYEIFLENQVLRTLSLTDSLTGLANHRYFWERLESEYSRAKRFKRSLSLVMADVDDFKKINDSEGHPKGDFILKQVGHILSTEKRNMDTIARYGGEEFAMVLPEASGLQAVEIAKRRLESLRKSGAPNMSFGVAELDDSCDSAKTLYERADKALYKAKALGKARVLQWTPDLKK